MITTSIKCARSLTSIACGKCLNHNNTVLKMAVYSANLCRANIFLAPPRVIWDKIKVGGITDAPAPPNRDWGPQSANYLRTIINRNDNTKQGSRDSKLATQAGFGAFGDGVQLISGHVAAKCKGLHFSRVLSSTPTTYAFSMVRACINAHWPVRPSRPTRQ